MSKSDLTQAELEANFRQAWHEAMTGQTYPIETLWDTFDAEDDEVTEAALLESFREGWEDMLNGRTYPIETLWDKLDDDEATDSR